MSLFFECAHGHTDSVFIEISTWNEHVKADHSPSGVVALQNERRAVLAARTGPKALPSGKTPTKVVAKTAAAATALPSSSWQLKLGTTAEAIQTAIPLNTGTGANLSDAFIISAITKIRTSCHGGLDFDVGSFMMSLYEQLLVSDCSDAFKAGEVTLLDTSAGTSAGNSTQVKWASIMEVFVSTAHSMSIGDITARSVGRFFARDIYAALQNPNSALYKYHTNKPNWARAYNLSRKWYAASSLFESMKDPEDRDAEEEAMLVAHKKSIIKISETDSMTVVKSTFNPASNSSPSASVNQALANKTLELIAKGDFAALSQLKQLMQ